MNHEAGHFKVSLDLYEAFSKQIVRPRTLFLLRAGGASSPRCAPESRKKVSGDNIQ